jgi:hypothetical protein
MCGLRINTLQSETCLKAKKYYQFKLPSEAERDSGDCFSSINLKVYELDNQSEALS